MTAILGLSAFYHDSAAALLVDGEIVAAAQQERFTRKKHDESFPGQAVAFCLERAGLAPDDLDYVVFYEKPLTKFERLLETYLAYAPWGYRSFRVAMPQWLRQKLYIPREIRQGLGTASKRRYVFTSHHESHAASAFFPSPFEQAAIITADGVGEWATTCYGVGQGHHIELTHEIRFPHSLGLLYSAFTYYCGFRVNSGEYKLMGLAPYGRPVYRDLILEHLVDLKPDGSFWMDMRFFNYCQGLTMTAPAFDRLFDGPPRTPESQLTRREMDLAASVQAVTEEAMLRMARHVHAQTGMKNLVLAGGVALNCVANGRVLREGPFEDIWIQPAAGDAGGALGAALFVWHQLLDRPRTTPRTTDTQRASLLGPSYDEADIRAVLDEHQAVYQRYEDDQLLCARVAAWIAAGKVVGWFQGCMEFGPRALGSRSIFADPRCPKMQATLNLKIKFRESFRPFAPMVLREMVDQVFEMRPQQDSPYMLLVAPVHPDLRLEHDEADDPATGFDQLQVRRSQLPAITHVDYSARVQTVDRDRHPRVHQLLTRFYQDTGCPVLINTSFNVRGEPIVMTPDDAYRCFMATDMDVLVLGQHVICKTDQKPGSPTPQREEHLARFELD